MKKILLFISVALILASCAKGSSMTHITTLEQLQAMKDNLSEDYILDNDIDASPTSGWNGGAGFIPVGTLATPFTGSFDGQDHKITGLVINRPATDYVGLFGYTSGHSGISNVELENCNITGRRTVGSLIGRNDGPVSGCCANGSAKSHGGTIPNWTEYAYLGGLIGYNNNGAISNSHAAVAVTTFDDDFISYVGGLIGYNKANSGGLSSCYATGEVTTGNGINWSILYIGGLIGWNDTDNNLSGCYATGNVTPGDSARDISYIAGLLGFNMDRSDLSDCYATGNVSRGTFVGSNDYIGGLIGKNDESSLSKCYTTGNVVGEEFVGGLVGLNDPMYNSEKNVSECYAMGDVTGTIEVGGLMGRNDNEGDISDSFAKGRVIAIGNYAGGLIGRNADGSDITDCFAHGNVESGGDYVGGLIGSNFESIVLRCCAAGNVIGRDYVGGLIGINTEAGIPSLEGQIAESHAVGDVQGNDFIGGLVGINATDISDCFSQSKVNGADWVGGLCGFNSDPVSNSYSAGAVTGTGANVGGLIGQNTGTVTNSFWDTEASGQAASAGGTGKTTEEMKTKDTFTDAGWDFNTIWNICEPPNYVPSYPFLRGNGRCGEFECTPATQEPIISFSG